MIEKIDCEVCLDLIPLVRDDVASDASRALVQAHTAGCEGCAAALKSTAVPPAPLPENSGFLKKARWTAILRLAVFVLVGVALGISLWLDSGFEFNLVVLPALGALAWLFCGRYWFWVPISLAVANFIAQIATLTAFGPLPALSLLLGSLAMGAVCGGLCLAGAGIAALLKYALAHRREAPRPKGRRALAGLAGILLPLVLLSAFVALNYFSVWENIAVARVQQYLDEHYPGHDLVVSGGHKQWNNSLNYMVFVAAPTEPNHFLAVRVHWLAPVANDLEYFDVRMAKMRLSDELTALAEAALAEAALAEAALADSELAETVEVEYAEYGYIPWSYVESGGVYDEAHRQHFTLDMSLDLNQQEVPMALRLETHGGKTDEATARQLLHQVKIVMEANGLKFDSYHIFMNGPNSDPDYDTRWYDIPAEELG